MSCIKLNPASGATMLTVSELPVLEPVDDCCPSISIDNWDEMPQGIEVSSQPLFCVLDEDENILGRTFLCKVVDEETKEETFTKMVSMVGAAAPEIYDPAVHGEESVCEPKKDCSAEPSGLTGWGE